MCFRYEVYLHFRHLVIYWVIRVLKAANCRNIIYHVQPNNCYFVTAVCVIVPTRQTRHMSYYFCSWNGKRDILPDHILALVIALFALCSLVIRLQWHQNVATTFAQLKRVTVNDCFFVIWLCTICSGAPVSRFISCLPPVVNKKIKGKSKIIILRWTVIRNWDSWNCGPVWIMRLELG